VDSTTIKKYAIENEKMRTLRMDGAEKVIKGITSIDEVLRITQSDFA
jgi:type II secretory ATPase GspE/PulE/Tfp pilus assembly ATPase PilB-like protein